MSGLDRNRYATDAEAALLREQIKNDEAAKRSLQASKLLAKAEMNEQKQATAKAQEAYNAARFAYDGILAREHDIDCRLSRARGYFHPLRKLPDEILGQILLEWRDQCRECWVGETPDDYDPKCDHISRHATAVCRWWRRVALGLRELWREVRVPFRRITVQNLEAWIRHLDIHRTRSGRLSLDLDVAGDWGHIPSSPTSRKLWTAVKRCFAQARFIGVRTGAQRLSSGFIDCFDQGAPYLLEFCANFGSLSSSADRTLTFFRSAPRLQKLKLASFVDLAWHPAQSALPGLTDADFDGIDAHGMHKVFRHTPNLSSLIVYAGTLDSTSAPADFSVHSGQLTTLDWNTSLVCDADLVRRMHLPALETAILGFYDRPQIPDATLTAFLQHPLSTVEYLTLDSLEAVLLDGFRYTHRIKSIRFNDYTSTSEAALRGLSQPTADGVWLCPRLTKVTLPAHVRGCDVVSLQEAILTLARTRAPAAVGDGRPLATLVSLKIKSDSYRSRTFPPRLDRLIRDILGPSPGASDDSSISVGSDSRE
ncbi:hypothetical protein AURDEDRAFT_163109 [Auricularia subglabra TFB-10046 SS5]|nr:hypothetical protein AURDEDRAFT_163109 [Auricularia subglabra TFB-10046 SS5]